MGRLTPESEESLDFCLRVLGPTVNGTDGDSVYLRTWDDYEHHGLNRPPRASHQTLERRVAAVEQRGFRTHGIPPIAA